MPKLHAMFYPEKPLAEIPNQEGFVFLGIGKNGVETICTVVKRIDGSYTLKDDKFPLLRAWRLLTN